MRFKTRSAWKCSTGSIVSSPEASDAELLLDAGSQLTMLDDELIVETPERVELRFILASVGNRFLAAAIDHIIQILLIIVAALIFFWAAGWSRVSSLGVWAAALMILVFFAIYWGYFVLFETAWSGQTPGKRIMKLRVIREDGRPVRFIEVFVRNLLRLLVDFMPP